MKMINYRHVGRRITSHGTAEVDTNSKQPSALDPAMIFAIPLILLSTVFRGGNRFLPLLILEVISIGLLLLLILQSLNGKHQYPFGSGFKQKTLLFLISSPIWIALIHLVPLPYNIWSLLPGRAPYAELFINEGSNGNWRAASLTPTATWAAIISGFPLIACFSMAFSSSTRQLGMLCRMWIYIALTQALLGLLQLGPFPKLLFGLISSEIVGTFASKNTFSNFLVMAVPLVIFELTRISQKQAMHDRRSNWSWGIILFILLTTLIAGTSRTGIATGLLVALLAVALLPTRRTRRWAGLPLAFWGMTVLLGLALTAGGLSWLERFDGDLLATDDATRALMREGAWQGTLAFWPLGSGLGSFSSVFSRFQAPELGRYLVDLAHSDYLQLFMELGLLGFILVIATLILLLERSRQLLRDVRGGLQNSDALATACGLGVLAFGLHAFVDYPMHIPANAMFASFLLGMFLRPSPEDRASGTT